MPYRKKFVTDGTRKLAMPCQKHAARAISGRTAGARIVETMLHRIEHGMFA
jgi:hypothetical protein